MFYLEVIFSDKTSSTKTQITTTNPESVLESMFDTLAMSNVGNEDWYDFLEEHLNLPETVGYHNKKVSDGNNSLEILIYPTKTAPSCRSCGAKVWDIDTKVCSDCVEASHSEPTPEEKVIMAVDELLAQNERGYFTRESVEVGLAVALS